MFCFLLYLVDGAVTLPATTVKAQQGTNVSFQCVVIGENLVAWLSQAKPARLGKPAIPSVRILGNVHVNRLRFIKIPSERLKRHRNTDK